MINIKLIIGLIILVVSNYTTYSYISNKYKLKEQTQLLEYSNEHRRASTLELAKAIKVVEKIKYIEVQASQNEQALQNETDKLAPSCVLSDDGLRLLNESIDRTNKASSP